MSYKEVIEPFQALAALEQKMRANACMLPKQNVISEQWVGIGFKLANTYFVSPLHSISEVIIVPKITRLPGVQKWIKGITHVRGVLMPIIDLNGYLALDQASVSARAKALVIKHNENRCGIMVEQVLGLHHFLKKNRQSTNSLSIVDNYDTYITGGYDDGDELWHIFDFKLLMEEMTFEKIKLANDSVYHA